MTVQDEWRLQGQAEYLTGVTLVHQMWNPSNSRSDHDHCEFCWDKFANYDGCLHVGYSTENRYRWICETCFNDFKDRFQWQIIEKLNERSCPPCISVP